jgi:hypothetical protein
MTASTLAALTANLFVVCLLSFAIFCLSKDYSFLFVSRLFFTQKYSVLNPLPSGGRAVGRISLSAESTIYLNP